ncbi:DegT/DnrJ/EryC1/StrS aminotransferase family protein, partial [bacterium]|nr:DegT/DnrJ/EryC1/StrS aminotransferase family protein [bacterium]
MKPKKKGSADFRYDTGPARIPWAAVGEPVRRDDVLGLMKFLMPPRVGKTRAYAARFKRVTAAVNALGDCSQPAGKLSLANNVKKLEDEACRLLGCRHAVFVTCATAGFEIAYKFAGLRAGDEVIAPA